MVLPQGVSKASGLQAVLRLFRLSEHNAIAIGNADNDHPLLQACEVGVAVGWGSPTLQACADHVVPGRGPADLAGYLRTLAAQAELPVQALVRRSVRLGWDSHGSPVTLATRGRNVLIAGDSRSGKSWLAGLLAEQLILERYSVCVIDPEGDYRSLANLPGVVTLGGEQAPPPLGEVTLALRHPDLSVVLDLARADPDEKQHYTWHLLAHLAALRKRTGLPHRIVVDEAHQFFDQAERLPFDLSQGGFTLVTYHLSDLDARVRAASDAIITTRLTDPTELEILRELMDGACSTDDWASQLAHLNQGEAALVPRTDEAAGCLRCFEPEPRLTSHVRHRQKYVDVPVQTWAAFVFTRDGAPTGQVARSMRDLAKLVREVAPESLEGHLRRQDLSRWVAEVYADERLAIEIRALERGAGYESLSDVRTALANVIERRYVRLRGPAELEGVA